MLYVFIYYINSTRDLHLFFKIFKPKNAITYYKIDVLKSEVVCPCSRAGKLSHFNCLMLQ